MEKGLVKNMHNVKARGLKAIILRKLGRAVEAEKWLAENRKVDAFDYLSMFEMAWIRKNRGEDICPVLEQIKDRMSNPQESCLQTARDYAEAKCYEEAETVLELCGEKKPMPVYYRA